MNKMFLPIHEKINRENKITYSLQINVLTRNININE